MRKLFALLLLTAALPSLADTIITREGASYSGQFASSKDEATFTDSAGINTISRAVTCSPSCLPTRRISLPSVAAKPIQESLPAAIRSASPTIKGSNTSFRQRCCLISVV